ncbi:hypothetical protein BD779DRAFT_270419 [Infundibulicybe gibba]|nr:hypothetical protein BD779DRAFT_270419 [Infundibulicybe gibba]
MTLTFQNLGQLIGAPAFTGEVGIDSINLISSQPGLVMHGYLNNNLPSKTTIFGEGTWSTASIVGGHQDFPVSSLIFSQYPRLTNDMISVNVFNASPGSIATKSGNMVRYGFDSEGNLVWTPANFNDQFPDEGNIRNITTRNINLFNSPSANALGGGMLGITSPVNSTQPLPTECSAPRERPRTPPRVPHDTAPGPPSTDEPDTQTAFYAYAKGCEDNTHGRYIINFATRDVADYWWRAVMDSVANGYPRFSDIQRISPQFYVHKPGNSNISETIKDSSCASHLARDVSFTLLSDGDTRGTDLIPIIHITDCISGGRYFVRSALDPELFWFWDGRVVRASRNRRTKFTIQATDAPQRERMLLVGSDNIIISVDEATPIGSSESQTLVHAPTPPPFKFSEFKNAFTVNQDDMIVRTWNGEDWKLVE